jgi:GNAT superfamily N-acetyltransferase
MFWRLKRSDFNAGKGDANRDAMHELVDSGAIPGFLGYVDDEPVAWCAIAPREKYPALQRSRILQPIDDTPVWSISCLFVRKDCRKNGVSVAMLKGAIDFVQKRGGKVVEGYPVEPKKDDMPAAFVWTGLASAFLKAGFKECARRSETRPIMRHEIKSEPRKRRTTKK